MRPPPRTSRPCHSRMRSARRCASGMAASASPRPSRALLVGIAAIRRKRVEIDPGHHRFPCRGPLLHAADVLGDRVEPGELVLGSDSPLKRAVGVEKGRLDGILGLAAIAESMEAVRRECAPSRARRAARHPSMSSRPSFPRRAACLPPPTLLLVVTCTRCRRRLQHRAMTPLGDFARSSARFVTARLLGTEPVHSRGGAHGRSAARNHPRGSAVGLLAVDRSRVVTARVAALLADRARAA